MGTLPTFSKVAPSHQKGALRVVGVASSVSGVSHWKPSNGRGELKARRNGKRDPSGSG